MDDRLDLSDWVFHFVHARNCSNEPDPLDEDSRAFPYNTDADKNADYEVWDFQDSLDPLDTDAPAQEVLLKILRDGHIRAGWSYRNGRPTIYGPNAAACFTEMPLYALLHYARQRENEKSVDKYAIALLRAEFYTHGGRPVIYGLSSHHAEVPNTRGWPRLLDAACGIGPGEQYRYVAMRLGTHQCEIDWTHEREWRWSIAQDQAGTPGLPVWLKTDSAPFSTVLLIVQTESDTERVLDMIKLLRDQGGYEGFEHDRAALEGTAVMCLERLMTRYAAEEILRLRIEDVPKEYIAKVEAPNLAVGYIERVKAVVDEARKRAVAAAAEYRVKYPGAMGWCGTASVMVDNSRSDTVHALLQLGYAHPVSRLGYYVDAATKGAGETQCMDVHIAAADAAIHYINTELHEAQAFIHTLDD